MSEQVVVKSFEPGRAWSSPDGKVNLTFFPVVFERNGSDFKAEWGKKDPKDPVVGEALDGEFYEKGGKWRFRLASKGGGGSGGGGNSKGWEKSPAEIAGSRHAHNLLVASENLEPLPPDPTPEAVDKRIELLDYLAGALDAQTAAISAEARDDQAPPQSGVHQRLDELLEAAGVNPAAARVIADFAVNPEHGMTPTEQDAAIDCLQKDNLKAGAVKRLSERAEAALGTPLPSASADDDIPF